tara:strand:+ start:1042 stop:1320 length:279 start_codon:yes stop_codon:yes gene_type:complete
MSEERDTKQIRINFNREDMIHPRFATFTHLPLNSVKEYQEKILKTSHLAGLFPNLNYWILFDVIDGKRTIKYIDDEDNYCVIISELIGDEEE